MLGDGQHFVFRRCNVFVGVSLGCFNVVEHLDVNVVVLLKLLAQCLSKRCEIRVLRPRDTAQTIPLSEETPAPKAAASSDVLPHSRTIV